MQSLSDAIKLNAEKLGDAVALEHLCNQQVITHAGLFSAVERLAGQLLSHYGAQQPVFLIFKPELDFYLAFYACIRANLIAIPYPTPPKNRQKKHNYDHQLAKLCETIGSKQAICSTDLAEALADSLDCQSWATVKNWPGKNLPMPPTGDDIALIQLTSGSTGTPKGVSISQANLFANAKAVVDRENTNPPIEHIISWLPHYHDMGLLMGPLISTVSAKRCLFIKPQSFLINPLTWLQAISYKKHVLAGGPNFALQHCVDRVQADDLSGLDLSGWDTLYTGAEFNSHQTLVQFADKFAACGLQRNCFRPSYGLAESTCCVTTPLTGHTPEELSVRFDSHKLKANQAEASENSELVLIANGTALAKHELLIVNPNTQSVCPAGITGEIWVAGPSVAQGYWNNTSESKKTFNQQLRSSEKSYLRTGDLGFIYEDRLYVLSRLKDLIVVRGKNIAPAQIENTVTESVLVNQVAALSTHDTKTASEIIYLCIELPRHAKVPSWVQLFKTLAAAVLNSCDCQIEEVFILATQAIPVTTSGKIKRQETYAKLPDALVTLMRNGAVYYQDNEALLSRYFSKDSINTLKKEGARYE